MSDSQPAEEKKVEARGWIYTSDHLPTMGKLFQCLWFFKDERGLFVTSNKAKMVFGPPMDEFWQFENGVEAIRPTLWAPMEVPDVSIFARTVGR
jgi:hypothetical protein